METLDAKYILKIMFKKVLRPHYQLK